MALCVQSVLNQAQKSALLDFQCFGYLVVNKA